MSTVDGKGGKPKIIMDERERGEIRTELSNLPLHLQIETLPVGDFILSNRHIVERKRGDDFVASIYDHRLFQQLRELKTACDSPLIILESPKRLFEREFIKKAPVYGAMVYINYKLKIPIVPSTDAKQTAQILMEYARAAQKVNSIPFFESFNQISPVSHISREDQSFFLQGLVDTGIIKANRLLDVVQTPEFVFHAIKTSQIEYTRGGNPKKITGIMANVSGIGAKYVHRNQQLLSASYSAAKQAKQRTRS